MIKWAIQHKMSTGRPGASSLSCKSSSGHERSRHQAPSWLHTSSTHAGSLLRAAPVCPQRSTPQPTRHSMAVAARYVSRFSPVSDSRLGVTPARSGARKSSGAVCNHYHGMWCLRVRQRTYSTSKPQQQQQRRVGTCCRCGAAGAHSSAPVALRPQRSTSRSVSLRKPLSSSCWYSRSCTASQLQTWCVKLAHTAIQAAWPVGRAQLKLHIASQTPQACACKFESNVARASQPCP